MLDWLKLSHHAHSGRLRPHEHTSYLPLGLLLLLVGFALTAYSVSAASPPPEAGSIGLTGIMPGKPPTEAATIKSPTNQQRFSTSPVTITGTCPEGTLVELFKNDIFAGSTICGNAGTFSLDVDLLIGQNTLIARVYDSLNQPGPDSKAVTVFYDALPPQAGPLASLDFGGAQLVLNTDAVFRGVFPEQELNIPVDLLGGTPPYAVNVQWGDSNNKVVPRGDNVSFKVGHTYRKPGTYQIALQATDAKGRVAFLTVAAIVNGQASAITAAALNAATPNQLLVLWPVYTSALAIVISFWLGERREKHILQGRGPLQPLQG
ncbi:MAG: hypothetical protein ACREGJ_04845 [Candidatus Saccharimonadales bacterium]